MAKLSTQEMQAIRLARPDIAPGMQFRHYKGGLYEVLLVSLDTDTMKARVIYKRIDGPNFDATAEAGLVYDRRIEEWEEPRFVREKPSKLDIAQQTPKVACFPDPEPIIRCMGINCTHRQGTCTATLKG